MKHLKKMLVSFFVMSSLLLGFSIEAFCSSNSAPSVYGKISRDIKYVNQDQNTVPSIYSQVSRDIKYVDQDQNTAPSIYTQISRDVRHINLDSIYTSNFTGMWNGIGEMNLQTENNQGKFACKNVTLSIEHTDSTFNISQCEFAQCDNNQEKDTYLKCAEVQLDIDNGKLFYQNKQVGFIKDSVAIINTQKDGWILSVTLKLQEDSSLKYNYSSMKPGSLNSIRTKAKLYK